MMYSEYHYSLPAKAPVCVVNTEKVKACLRCGVEFATKCPSKKRCAACQPIAAAASVKRANDKRTAKRVASRSL